MPREEFALPALEALLVALRAPGFGFQILLRRQQIGKLFGAARAELVEAYETAAPLGQAVVGSEGLGGCDHGRGGNYELLYRLGADVTCDAPAEGRSLSI
jgi:hypothetical protein